MRLRGIGRQVHPLTSLESPGKGFAGFVGSGSNTTGTFLASSPSIVSFDGTPNATHTPSLDNATTVATGGSGDGWNLIGNPFPATLDWSKVTLTDVNNAIYIWNPSTEKYNYYVNGVSAPTGSYAGSTITNVPPMQSFWVQANGSSPAIGALSSATHTTFKSSPTVYKTMPDNIIIKLSNHTDSTDQDAFWLKNTANTSLSFEGQKMLGNTKIPTAQMCTLPILRGRQSQSIVSIWPQTTIYHSLLRLHQQQVLKLKLKR